MFEQHHNIRSSWTETVPPKRDSDYFTSAIEKAHIDYRNSKNYDAIDELLDLGYQLDAITDDLINDHIEIKNSQDEPDFYIEILLP